MATPLSRKNMNLTAGWVYPKSGDLHAGFDYGVKIGTQIFAVRGGHILRKVDTEENMDPDEDGFPNKPVNFILQAITYKNQPATVLYLHISPNVKLDVGDEVVAGQRIAKSGHNGNSTGPHLHVAVMKGHQESPFKYLDNLTKNSPKPNGLATNGITFYPPSLVYGRGRPNTLAKGTIIVKDLTFGTMDSPSVRRLQHRLNGIHLDGGETLPESGNYLEMTRAEVTKWQIQKLGAAPGSAKADGNLHRRQLRFMFGKHFKLVH